MGSPHPRPDGTRLAVANLTGAVARAAPLAFRVFAPAGAMMTNALCHFFLPLAGRIFIWITTRMTFHAHDCPRSLGLTAAPTTYVFRSRLSRQVLPYAVLITYFVALFTS